MRLPRILLIVILSGLALIGGWLQPVSAQVTTEPTGFKNVALWLNPEYDDPRLLVMLEGTITGADAPVTVRFLVPAAAEMYSAGSMDAQGNYTGGPPARRASQYAGWDEISYQLTTNVFRVEYYDPVIPAPPNKLFGYDFRTLYPVSDLVAHIQQPLKSTNFNVNPKGNPGTDSQGFTVYAASFSNVTPDAPLHFDISYTKTDANPSLNMDETGGENYWMFGGVLILILAVAGMFGWIVLSRRQTKVKTATERRAGATVRQTGGKTRFCTQCGKPLDGSYQFCPSCGSKQRRSP